MKKRIIKLLVVICLLCVVALTIASCKGVKMTISFVVDSETYATIDTSGNEMVTIPQSPSKDGYTFDGWYWDNGTWQRPFTANSLLNEPLTADMSVYAKFTEIHTHTLTLQPAAEATCTKEGNSVYYTCTCGQMFADERSDQELTAIPTINKIDHTPTEWITDSEPTCTANGSKHTECSVCHTTLQTEAINASGHTPETEWKIDSNATCTANGSKHTECSVCHTTLQSETIQASGHTPETEWKIDSNATCTTNGSKHLECSVCHATLQTQTIPSTGHTYSTEWASDERGHWHVATCEHKTETTKVENHTYDKNYKCKVCNYQDTSLHGTAIATEIFDVDGETLYAKVPNAQTTFSFINAIQVADDATFIVATDLAASNVIRTKTVSLEIGDNTYYVLVENGNDIQLYTVTLRRRPIYTVTFATNGGTACDSQQVEEDSFATESTTSKTGYTFAGWDYDFEQAITANTTITASWTVNEYTITYDANGGELAETEYNATYDSAYTLAVPTREGHTFQGWYIDETQITNVEGQSLANWTYSENKTVTAKWSINSYTLTITNPNFNAGTVTGAGTKVYNSEVTVTATEPNLGYKFIGWYIGDELLSIELICTFNMPAINLTLNANYKLRDEMSNYNFTSTNTTCTITGVKDKTITEATLPNYITAIGKSAFSGCSRLTLITIPDGVTTIGMSAFYGCSSLETVYWNASACTIEGVIYYTIFSGCINLTTVVIGDNVTQLLSYVFEDCSSLTSVYYTGDIVGWCNISFSIYTANPLYYAHNLYIDNELITEVVIPDTITQIMSYAFEGCTNITSITIPSSVTTIGDSAFFGCSSLINVTIPDSVTTIGNGAFSGCSSLINVTIPDSVTTIGNGAFSGCSSLTSVIIPDSVMSIGAGAFRGCGSLESITLPFVGDSRKTPSDKYQYPFGYIFGTSSYTGGVATTQYYLGSNTSITTANKASTTYHIPSSLKNVTITGGIILYGAFYNCSKLTNVTIGNSVTTISEAAFYGCSSLINVTISDSVTTIGDSAFSSCSRLTNVYYGGDIASWCEISGLHNIMSNSRTLYINNEELTGEIVIPDTVTQIKAYAFEGCTNVTSITIPSSVTSIGSCAFYNCSNLGTVYWNATACTSVGLSSYPIFKGCSILTTVVIGDNVTTIGDWAFYGCSVLTGVYYMGDEESWYNIVFSNWSANPLRYACNLYIDNELITEIVIPDTVTQIKAYAFEGCTNITSITIPSSITSIGDYAFYNCDSLTNVTIGNSVTTISEGAFYGCSSLINVTIPDSVTTINDYAFRYCSSLTSIIIYDSVTSISSSAFLDCWSLRNVYYIGTASDWANSIGSDGNGYLNNAKRYYYSETEPELNSDGTAYNGNYWHYTDNNEIVVWVYNKENY